MNKRIAKLTLTTLVLTAGLTSPSFVYASDCSNNSEYQALFKLKEKHPDLHVLTRSRTELNLTKSQKAQFEAMINDINSERANREFLQTFYMQKKKFIMSPTIDEAILDSLAAESKNIIKLDSRTITFKHDFYNLLNSKQKIKYNELQQQERDFHKMTQNCPEIKMSVRESVDFNPIRHINELNLTQEQKAKIMPIIKNDLDTEKKLLSQFDYKQWDEIIQSPLPIDPIKLNSVATEKANIIIKIGENELLSMHDIYQSLNAQQQAQFIKMLEKDRDHAAHPSTTKYIR